MLFFFFFGWNKTILKYIFIFGIVVHEKRKIYTYYVVKIRNLSMVLNIYYYRFVVNKN